MDYAAATSLPPDLWLKAIFNQAAVGIAVVDREGRILEANRRMCQITGRTGAELARLSCADITHPEDWPSHKALLDELTSGKRAEFFVEKRYVRSDGSMIWVNLAVSPLRDVAGRTDRLLEVVQDITDRKRTENSLRASEDRFTRFMQHLPGLAWIKDEAGRYLFANDAAQRAFNRTPEQLYGQTDEATFPPEVARQFRENDLKAMCAGSGIQVIETLEHTDGVHHSIVSKFPIPGASGDATLVGGMAIDITAYRQTELALRETEARFRSLADTAPVVIWVSDLDGFEFVNREFIRFAGANGGDLRGKSWDLLLHPDDHENYISLYAGAMAAGQPFEAQARLRRADGEYRWLKSTGVPRFTDDGNLLGFVGCSVDITEIKQSEEALREADRKKDEFLAILAHELRNPLAPATNALHILRMKAPPIPELQWAQDILATQVQRMSRLIDDLMDVSRITSNKLTLRRERTTLHVIVKEALNASRPHIEQANHQLTVVLPPDAVLLDADVVRMAQVLSNLLNNAAKYTQPGGRIWLTGTRERGHIVLSVKDNGIGIPSEMLPEVFDMFMQVDRSLTRSTSGLGIGLTLVKRLVEMHDGTVEARSNGQDKGSEFIIRLPALDAPEQPPVQEPGIAGSFPRSNRRVLIVDDNALSANSLSVLLSLAGNEVRTAYDGVEAITAAEEFRPEVILLDLGLPLMDGYETCARIRSTSWGKAVVMVALTGWGQEQDRRRSREAGFDHHIVKPANPIDLMKLLAGTAGRTP